MVTGTAIVQRGSMSLLKAQTHTHIHTKSRNKHIHTQRARSAPLGVQATDPNSN